jgi:hypothetical protein
LPADPIVPKWGRDCITSTASKRNERPHFTKGNSALVNEVIKRSLRNAEKARKLVYIDELLVLRLKIVCAKDFH